MGVGFRQIAAPAVLATLLVPVCFGLLPHGHDPEAVPASDPHDLRHHLCGRVDQQAGPPEGCCPICLSHRSLSQSLLALGRKPDRPEVVGHVPDAVRAPSVLFKHGTRTARAPPAC